MLREPARVPHSVKGLPKRCWTLQGPQCSLHVLNRVGNEQFRYTGGFQHPPVDITPKPLPWWAERISLPIPFGPSGRLLGFTSNTKQRPMQSVHRLAPTGLPFTISCGSSLEPLIKNGHGQSTEGIVPATENPFRDLQ